MNSALFHAARPGDIRAGGVGVGGRGGTRPGMREAAAIAKEMGFSQEEFGPQTANMWKMLDDLAVTDGAAYTEMAKAGAEALRKPRGKFFTPVAGFVVKASLERPWAPPPTSTFADGSVGSLGGRKVVENAPAGTKVFMNLCSHEGVPAPIDQADRPVDVTTEGRNASGLRIPMFVSRVRETVDHSDKRALAVDVVFHPWLLRCSKGEPRFRDQVVALASGWITQEHPGLVISRRPKLLKLCTYKGGDGPKGGAPVPFPADDAFSQADSPDRRTPQGGDGDLTPAADGISGGGGIGGSGLLDDPKSLLAAIKHSAAAGGDDDNDRPAGTLPGGPAKGNGSRKPSSTSKSSSDEGVEGGGAGGEGVAAALGLSSSSAGKGGGTAARDILLPRALAGLTSNDGGHGGGGRGDEERIGSRPDRVAPRGPLISEIVPETARESKPGAPGGGGGVNEEGDTPTRAGATGGKNGAKVGGRGGGGGKRRASAVKKGFLSSLSSKDGKGGGGGRERAPLYPPSGSENGAEPSAYVKLMSRCKVVDTRDHTKEEMDAAMRAHASGGGATSSSLSLGNLPLRSTTKPSQGTEGGPVPDGRSEEAARVASATKTPAVKKGFLSSSGSGGRLYGEEGSREGGATGRGGRASKADHEFERLMALADPEMGDDADGTGDKTSAGDIGDPLTEQLAQLAKILGPAVPFPESTLGGGTGVGVALNEDKCSPANKGGTQTPAAKRADGLDITTPGEAPPPSVPAPASTIADSSDGDLSQTPPRESAKPSRGMASAASNHVVVDAAATLAAADAPAADAAAAAAANEPEEREPMYRIEALPPRVTNGGGDGDKRDEVKPKRVFVVIIHLPDLSEGDGGDGKTHESMGLPQPGRGGEGDWSSNKCDASGNPARKRTGPSLSDVELDVSPAVLHLKVPGKYRLRVEMPCVVDEESVTAKFIRSRADLKVSVQEK